LGRYKTKLSPRKIKKKIPIWLVLVGTGLIMVATFAFIINVSRPKAEIEVIGVPKIKVEQESYDYGNVKLGAAPIRTVVRVTNVGDQPLIFKEAPYLEVLEGC